MKIDGISAIVVILIASFAVDRIVTGLLFLLSFIKPWNRTFPSPATTKDAFEHDSAVKRKKLIYFAFAGILAGLIVYYGEIGIFKALSFKDASTIMDYIVTGLILMGGSDRIAAVILKSSVTSRAKTSTSEPVEITGKLILTGEGGKKLSQEIGT
ncbi:MAG: hypothetical protein GY777_11190 [Candidatus Brocadiaceae bacterium]|nr:hypothetical protein [Candidatus Brocadiaceae bacterium]